MNFTLNFYNINEKPTLNYIPYSFENLKPVVIPPINHVRPQHRPASIHSFVHHLSSNDLTKRKKKVSWKEMNSLGVTFSKDEYDRKIDNNKIKENIEYKKQYYMMKFNHIQREPSVFNRLDEMNF